LEGLPTQVFIPVGVILAALIGGFFSVISLIVSKEQKISEFRQQWIDSLRQEISDHIATVITLAALRENQTGSDKELLKETTKEQQHVASTFTSIKLRVNPEDKDKKIKKLNNEFLDALEKGRRLYNDREWEEARKHCNVITEKSIPMLKAEWERVKRGETTYIWTKWIAIMIFAIASIGALSTVCLYWPVKQESQIKAKAIRTTYVDSLSHNNQLCPLADTSRAHKE